jgi:hypothetical protein
MELVMATGSFFMSILRSLSSYITRPERQSTVGYVSIST